MPIGMQGGKLEVWCGVKRWHSQSALYRLSPDSNDLGIRSFVRPELSSQTVQATPWENAGLNCHANVSSVSGPGGGSECSGKVPIIMVGFLWI
jgi:hypothetical protein